MMHFPGIHPGGDRLAAQGAQRRRSCGRHAVARSRAIRRTSRPTTPGCRPAAGASRTSPISTRCRQRARRWWRVAQGEGRDRRPGAHLRAGLDGSGLLLPAAVLVGLPIGRLEALAPSPRSSARAPPRPPRRPRRRTAARCADSSRHRPAPARRRSGSAHWRRSDCRSCTVSSTGCIAASLSRSVPCAQEAVVAIGPQMRVERLDALLGRRLHHDAPAALERFLQQLRQHALRAAGAADDRRGSRSSARAQSSRNAPPPAGRAAARPSPSPSSC